MGLDIFRPHWRHAQCGGIVVAIDSAFQCTKCEKTGEGIGATIPADNEREYFLSHLDLQIVLLDACDAAAYETNSLVTSTTVPAETDPDHAVHLP